MTANGNSPLDSMRTLEHYLSDIMRTGAADTPEHVKGKCPGLEPCGKRTKIVSKTFETTVYVFHL